MMKIIDPAGSGRVRVDLMGDGHFDARRRSGGKVYGHRGLDTVVVPGQWVVAPVGGLLSRIGICYADDEYRKISIVCDQPWTVEVLYLDPLPCLVGVPVIQGQVIGRAQDITLRGLYRVGGMQPHLHTEVRHGIMLVDPQTLMEGVK